MWKWLGALLVISGVAGVLYSWCCEQKEKQKRLESMLFFLQKSVYVMQREKIKVAELLIKHIEQNKSEQGNKEEVLVNTLEEILKRLSTNTYPNGQMVWEGVFQEEKKNWNLNPEIYAILVQAGNGFFGRSREENVNFLEKSIKELEEQQAKLKQKNAQERKVWVPVGMLGTMMVIILFL